MADEKKNAIMPHHLILDNQRELTLSGINDVDSFDDTVVIVYIEGGELTIKGSDLQIVRLSLETGDMQIDGHIESMAYAQVQSRASGFFGRLFK